ncbi:MAG: hypothetical protein ACREB3_16360, partial [Burkholderiales bacterium]
EITAWVISLTLQLQGAKIMPADTRYTSARSRRTYTFDAGLEFKDAGLIAADAAAQVDGSAKVVDLGTGLWEGDMVIDVSAIEIASGDEKYEIIVQLSSSPTFASVIAQGVSLSLGATATLIGSDIASTVGRYILPFHNEGVDGVTYRYARLYTNVTGTLATGINYTAIAAPRYNA